MKLAVAGKGGVGKTFIAGTISRLLARDDYKVIAVDADPNINLSYSLGIGADAMKGLTPISENELLISSRTAIDPSSSAAGLFNIAPNVSDIADRYGVVGPDGVRLLVMGTVKGGGTGCMCPANALLRALLQHLLIQRQDVIVLDLEAGLEPFARGTARRMDVLVNVFEPNIKSLDTSRRIVDLARDIEIEKVVAVGNKIAQDRDRRFIENGALKLGMELIGCIPLDESIARADFFGRAALDFAPDSPALRAVAKITDELKRRYLTIQP